MFSSDEALGFDVPADADSVELWFHAVAPGCDPWDSNYGSNWRFPVMAARRAVGWAGDWGSSTDRACPHGAGVPQPITIDEYMRERACIFVDADVWVPGATDAGTPHPEWIQARGRVGQGRARTDRPRGSTTRASSATTRAFAGACPYEVRNRRRLDDRQLLVPLHHRRDPFERAAQPSGEDWTLMRAFPLPTP